METSTHFLPVKTSYKVIHLTRLFIAEIVRLLGVPNNIVSAHDPKFTSRLWKAFHHAIWVKLNLRTSNHPQSDEQMEMTIQVIEDMLWVHIMESEWSWNHHLPLTKFSNNNSYHSSIGIAPYEALYRRKCSTPLCWEEVRDKGILGPNIIQETMETIRIIP